LLERSVDEFLCNFIALCDSLMKQSSAFSNGALGKRQSNKCDVRVQIGGWLDVL